MAASYIKSMDCRNSSINCRLESIIAASSFKVERSDSAGTTALSVSDDLTKLCANMAEERGLRISCARYSVGHLLLVLGV